MSFLIGYSRQICIFTATLVAACETQIIEKTLKDAGQKNSTNQECATEETQLRIVDGEETSEYASVVMLVRERAVPTGKKFVICTGTFVSHNAILTAAHCLDDSPTGGMRAFLRRTVDKDLFSDAEKLREVLRESVAPIRVVHHGYTENELVNENGRERELGHTIFDVAVLIFPDHTAPETMRITRAQVKANDPGVIVGFGFASREPDAPAGPAIKRKGAVVISPIQKDKGLITLHSRDPFLNNAPEGEMYASSAHGDSGGPLIVNGALVGINSSGNKASDALGYASFFVDVLSEHTRNLFNHARKLGAILPDLPTMVESARSAGAAAARACEP